MALNGLLCADMPLRTYTLTYNVVYVVKLHSTFSLITGNVPANPIRLEEFISAANMLSIGAKPYFLVSCE